MIIGIDASRALRAQRTGTERYSLELINALLDLASAHTIRLYVPKRPKVSPFRPQAEMVELPGERLWTHTRLGPYARRHPPDVLFVPAHVLPLAGPPRTVVTVHDLGYEHFPQAHPWRQRQYLRWSTRRHARVATQIIADSRATKDDLISLYHADPDRIHVVYPSPDPDLHPETDPARIAYVRNSYGIPPNAEYLLHIGTLQPRKNLARLIDAFARVRKELPDRKLHLVLAGSPGYGSQSLYDQAKAMGLQDHVRFTGFARVHDIPSLYAGAACYVFPSLAEGFGFPALEAQICGVPLACSSASSLPEVAGDGALYFDPTDVTDMTKSIVRLLVEPELCSELVAKGRDNVVRFPWAQTARQTMQVLEMAARA
ncbi:MAG: glycosyltransferase family 4 protein [Caldilineales bacterium]|nr:glycosyltransferase family 4 protein [Caldilineales bacterium]